MAAPMAARKPAEKSVSERAWVLMASNISPTQRHEDASDDTLVYKPAALHSRDGGGRFAGNMARKTAAMAKKTAAVHKAVFVF